MVAAIQQPNINYKALSWTIGVHALLLLLFILLHYSVENKPPVVDNGGLEINLGSNENGNGNDLPMKRENPSEYHASVVFKTATSKNALPINILQTNDATAPLVNVNKNNKKQETPENDKAQPLPKPEPQPQPRYIYPGETGKGGNSANDNKQGSNEGNTSGPGDRGVPNGTPGAANYTGIPGNGTGGIGHTLTGRQITPDKFEAEFRESGKVVIHVTVDRNGTIVNKRVVSSSSPQLTRIALEKLNAARFSKSESSEPQQFGDVTFYFKTH